MLLLEIYISILVVCVGIIAIAIIYTSLWLISFFGGPLELSTALSEYKIWINFFNLYTIGAAVWLANSYFRRLNSGNLLFRMGRTKDNREIFWFSLWGIGLVAFQAQKVWYLVIANEISPYMDLESEFSILLFGCAFSITCFIRSLNKLELRENGIWFMCSFFKWQQIKTYSWKPTKRNLLTVQVKCNFVFVKQLNMDIVIPERYKNVVDQILTQRLLERSTLSIL